MIYDPICPFCGKDTGYTYGKGNFLIGYVENSGVPKVRTYFHNECYTKNRRKNRNVVHGWKIPPE